MKLHNCDMKSFSHRCKGKKIACYGIGKEFQRILRGYFDYGWVKNIEFLVDGNFNREGELIQVNNQEYSIMSLDSFRKMVTSDVIILITCMAYAEVVNEFNRVPEFNNIDCYLVHFMFSLSEGEELKIQRRKEMLIPPIIHYCWFGRGEKPDLYKKCIDSWYKHCPDYEIKEWNEDNCDINEILYTKQAYECGKYGFVPDYFRLKIIYENGGIYLDTDVEILKNIDDLRYNEAFCGLEVPGEAAFGLGFGAVKGHLIMNEMMERYKTMSFLKSDGSIDDTASPVFQSEDLLKNGMSYRNKLQEIKGLTIYPIEVLSPQNVYTGLTTLSQYTYMWHHFDGSWISGDRLKQKLERQKKAAVIQQMIDVNEGKN